MLFTDLMKQKGEFFVKLIYDGDFIQGIANGNLAKSAVEHYLRADHNYLNNFSDIYALLITKTTDVNVKKFFLSQIEFIVSKEELVAHHCLARYTGRDYSDIVAEAGWYPSADHYIKHMYYNAYKYGLAETVSAMSPCPWIYKRVAEEILKHNAITNNNPFKQWIEFYAGSLCDDCLNIYDKIINDFTETATEEEKNRIMKNFIESCEHEKKFFEMAVKGERWLMEI